jgi:hypothetical protein
MKKLLFLLLIFVGCEKEPLPEPIEPKTYCWDCLSETSIGGVYYSAMLKICGLNETQAGKFEALNTWETSRAFQRITCTKDEK